MTSPVSGQAVEAAVQGKQVSKAGRLSIPDLPAAAGGGTIGTTALLHFVYKFSSRGQFVAPAFTAPLDDPLLQQVRQARPGTSCCIIKCMLDAWSYNWRLVALVE